MHRVTSLRKEGPSQSGSLICWGRSCKRPLRDAGPSKAITKKCCGTNQCFSAQHTQELRPIHNHMVCEAFHVGCECKAAGTIRFCAQSDCMLCPLQPLRQCTLKILDELVQLQRGSVGKYQGRPGMQSRAPLYFPCVAGTAVGFGCQVWCSGRLDECLEHH